MRRNKSSALRCDVARFTTHEPNLSCNKSTFCNKICTYCAFYRPKPNLFCSKRGKSNVWRDYRAILSKQKSVLTQFNLIFCNTGLNVCGKTRNIAFQLVLQQCCKTGCTFFCRFFRGALLSLLKATKAKLF